MSDSPAAKKARMSMNSTVLTFTARSQTFKLFKEDVDKHPGSLLHSLASSIDDSTTLQLTAAEMPDSPFSTWPEAAGVTAALYRHKTLPCGLLSKLLASTTSASLVDELTALLDFLLLPGPLGLYLPPMQQIPLLHMGVLDLHHAVAASKAVELMLSSPATSQAFTSGSLHEGAAFFYISTMGESDRAYSAVEVHALSIKDDEDEDALPWRPSDILLNEITISFQSVDALQLPATPDQAEAWRVNKGSRYGHDYDDEYPDDLGMLSDGDRYERLPVGTEHFLGGRILDTLSAAVSKVAVNGTTGGLKCTIIMAQNTDRMCYDHPPRPIWVIHWKFD